METMYITHPSCKLHEMGSWHPESPQRLDAISDQLLSSGLMPYLAEKEAGAASREDILRVHSAYHLDRLREMSPEHGYTAIDSDTLMNPHTLDAAYHAAGAGITAVDAIMAGEASTVFCAVRPPGHHAEHSRAMGFCFFNNVAIAARYALSRYGLERIAIIDFDVHHGNGTEEAFAGDERVLMCSFFQHPFFPNSGFEHPASNMVNVPLEAYSTGVAVRQAVQEQWLPRLQAHAPQMLFISAGFDAHREDDMAQMGLVEADYAWITDRLVEVADRYAQGRIVSTLEGGYNQSALARSVVAHMRSLSKL